MCQEKGLLLIDSGNKKAQAWLDAKTQLMPSGFYLPPSLRGDSLGLALFLLGFTFMQTLHVCGNENDNQQSKSYQQ